MKIYHTTGSIIQRTAWLLLRVFFSFFLRLHVQGIDHVKKLSTNVIFASNHANELDPLIIVSCLPFFSRHLPLVFVSREKSFYAHIGWKSIFYGGKLFTLMGAFQAYSGLKDFHKALPHHLAALSVGRSVCIFPMGKKHLDTNLENAKGGVTFLAQETGLPIIPVRIIGAENITLRDFFLRQGSVSVIFGEPVYINEQIENGAFEAKAILIMKKIFLLKIAIKGSCSPSSN